MLHTLLWCRHHCEHQDEVIVTEKKEHHVQLAVKGSELQNLHIEKVRELDPAVRRRLSKVLNNIPEDLKPITGNLEK